MLCLKPSITKCWNNDSFGTRAVSVSIGTSNGMSNEMSNCPEKSQWSFEDLQPKTRYSIWWFWNWIVVCPVYKYLQGDLIRFAYVWTFLRNSQSIVDFNLRGLYLNIWLLHVVATEFFLDIIKVLLNDSRRNSPNTSKNTMKKCGATGADLIYSLVCITLQITCRLWNPKHDMILYHVILY